MTPDAPHQSDLANIKSLHQRDMIASKEGDYKTLRTLLTNDAVMMPPGGNWIRGEQALDQNYRQMEEAMNEIEIIDYRLDFEEIKILGQYAYEWGTITGKTRDNEGNHTESSYKVMRILKKTDNGKWKVHRAIWNSYESE